MKNYIRKQGIFGKRILAVCLDEFREILGDRIVLAILFLVPLFYCTLFAFVYSGAVLHDIPVAVFDQDNSSLSRSLVQDMDVNEKVKVAVRVNTMQEVEKLMQSGEVKGAVVIPANFQKMVMSGMDVHALSIIDGSNLVVAFNLRKGMLSVNRTFCSNVSLAQLSAAGIVPVQAIPILKSVEFKEDIWYNPTYSYFDYIMFGSTVMALHQVLLVTVCLVVPRERASKKWHGKLNRYGPGTLLIGKSLPYGLVTFAEGGLIFMGLHVIWGLPVHGPIWVLMLGLLMFMLAVLGLAFLISTNSRDEVEASAYIFLVAFPFFIISGFSWPLYLMPAVLRDLSYLLPTSWMLVLVKENCLKGLGFSMIRPSILVITMMAIGTWTIVYWQWKKEARTIKDIEII